MNARRETSNVTTRRTYVERAQLKATTATASLVVVACACLSANSDSNEDFFSTIDVATQTQAPSRFSFLGYIQQDVRYGLSAPDAGLPFPRTQTGLSSAKTSAFGQVKIDGHNENSHWMLSAKAETNWAQWQNNELDISPNNSRLFLKDAYFDTRFHNGTWLRLGNQIVSWGESEGLPIADILAPQDSRAPGQAELRDIREQIPAAKLNLPIGDFNLELVSTYKAGSNRLASDDEPFYPYLQLDAQNQSFMHIKPTNEWEFAAKLGYQFNGGDLSIIAGDTNNNDYSSTSVDKGSVVFQQSRITSLAVVTNKTFGNWLLRSEAGAFWNQPLQASMPFKTNQYRFMGGAEYSGWTNWRLSVELNGVINEQSQGNNKQNIGYVLRASQNAYNERLKNQLWLLNITGDLGSVVRWDTTYELSDSWQVGAGIALYNATNTDSPYYIYKDNDDVLLSVKYSFY